MNTKSYCMMAMVGMCECDSNSCQGKLVFKDNAKPHPEYEAYKAWYDQLGTANVPLDAYTKEGLAQTAFFAGMRYANKDKAI